VKSWSTLRPVNIKENRTSERVKKGDGWQKKKLECKLLPKGAYAKKKTKNRRRAKENEKKASKNKIILSWFKAIKKRKKGVPK